MRFRHAAKAETECPKSFHYEVGDKTRRLICCSAGCSPLALRSAIQFTHLVCLSLVVSEEKLCVSAPKIVDPAVGNETARGYALVLRHADGILYSVCFPLFFQLGESCDDYMTFV